MTSFVRVAVSVSVRVVVMELVSIVDTVAVIVLVLREVIRRDSGVERSRYAHTGLFVTVVRNNVEHAARLD